ncbi:MAG: hypothetical protein HQ567_19415 [Candidatus Nealsonbacteria bacterium]|nr:hypothetical protein [Candidatus Nealsonbacteria bacterium]
MARTFRFYEKKRGHRRTGSKTFASAGEAAFFAAMLLLGCVGAVLFVQFLVVPEWRVNHEFRTHECRVLDSRVKEKEDEDGTLYRGEVLIEYKIDGKTYKRWTYDLATTHDTADSYTSRKEDAAERVADVKVDPKAPRDCWYDPAEPGIVVLVRGYSWWLWLVGLVPISFIVIGVGGVVYTLLHWGKSTERRSAITQRVRQRDPFDANGKTRAEYPNVPTGAEVTNSPGTKLKFRLPIGQSPGWKLFTLAMVCLIWNGVVSVFVAMAVSEYLAGNFSWLTTAFVIPFALAGIGLIVVSFRQLLVTTGVGPTTVEISDHPLHPGQRCRVLVSQSGRLKFNSLKVMLVCEEEATYRQGTNTRTEAWEVHRQEVSHHERFEVKRGLPFVDECDLAMPAGAMHSFKAEHNEIKWKVVVQGDADGWPDYERSFPVVVRPRSGETRR